MCVCVCVRERETDILDILKTRQSRDSLVGRVGSNPFRDKICISAAELSDRSWGLLSLNSMSTGVPWGYSGRSMMMLTSI